MKRNQKVSFSYMLEDVVKKAWETYPLSLLSMSSDLRTSTESCAQVIKVYRDNEIRLELFQCFQQEYLFPVFWRMDFL